MRRQVLANGGEARRIGLSLFDARSDPTELGRKGRRIRIHITASDHGHIGILGRCSRRAAQAKTKKQKKERTQRALKSYRHAWPWCTRSTPLSGNIQDKRLVALRGAGTPPSSGFIINCKSKASFLTRKSK